MLIPCNDCNFENIEEAKFCGKCGIPLLELTEDGLIDQGYILERRYEIIDIIKEGGMGCVYKARDIRLDRECAVKEMLSVEDFGDQEYAIRRFQEEALMLSRLRHVGLPIVMDYFIENERYYLVMDFIKGQDLQNILDEYDGKPVEEDKVINWSIQVLEVLDYLHNQKPPIVYRDLKPGNIMIRDYDNRAVLVDFGIARTIRPDSDTTKTIIGTFGYCAIEQVKGKPEPRSDIFSMGATMHHMLTGVQPQLLNIDPIEKINPNISKKLMRIVNKATQEEVEKRFSSARDMIETLVSSDMPAKLMAEDYPDMVFIPAGEFWMGSNSGDPNEYPRHKIFLKSFLIDKFPVTNSQFDKFVRETGAKIVHWKRYFKAGTENSPVVNVNFYEAEEYAKWSGKRLPSEAEWEKTARGTDGRRYPWGNNWEDYPIDTSGLMRVGTYPERASPYGAMDMSGFIYEWTSEWYYPYPYKGPYEKGKIKVVRGGRSSFATCSYRGFERPDYRNPSRGFRCVIEC
ncbi:MAG TPA: SUMF1/EgtB/PvdO family nonheme iron enzyme [Candidatus Eremiobacteraeota bacterium]|nr:MAG: Serine/threonine-protein kinase C [bacterium ADurb.Bin363]HPZ06677.1 SUMF1/EgtB/PvdO family nonheme iron enzyme [Candidatus Eremiobacteraeota bacterium]